MQLSKTKQALLIVALMLTAIPMVVDGVIIPISNSLYEAFPADTAAVNFILSGPQLLVAISSLAAMPLMQRFSKKPLLVVFGSICAASLVFGAAIENAYYMAAMRSVAGVCTGIINVVGLALFAEVFTDFIGKEALLEYKKAPKRSLKTLVWDPEDIVDIQRSQFTDDPYCEIEWMTRESGAFGVPVYTNDKVLDMDGNEIGMSGGRMMDAYHHEMLSLAIMDIEFCEDGKQVQVVWGEPGTRQKLVKATVAPVPYNMHLENRSMELK